MKAPPTIMAMAGNKKTANVAAPTRNNIAPKARIMVSLFEVRWSFVFTGFFPQPSSRLLPKSFSDRRGTRQRVIIPLEAGWTIAKSSGLVCKSWIDRNKRKRAVNPPSKTIRMGYFILSSWGISFPYTLQTFVPLGYLTWHLGQTTGFTINMYPANCSGVLGLLISAPPIPGMLVSSIWSFVSPQVDS